MPTTKSFLLEKDLNWTHIGEMREEIKRNNQAINRLHQRNELLYHQMQKITTTMQKKAEQLDKEYT